MKKEKHASTDPDIFVRARVGVNSWVQSYTVRNVQSHNFGFNFIVPKEGLPRGGLEIAVYNDDGTGDLKNQETMGLVRIPTKKIGELAGSGAVESFKDGSVERLEVAVRELDSDKEIREHVVLQGKKNAQVVKTLNILPGQLVEIRARGNAVISAGNNDSTKEIEQFPLGVPLALIATKGFVQPLAIEGCRSMISMRGGKLVVGLNDKNPGSNFGTVDFTMLLRYPTLEEWSRSNDLRKCPSLDSADPLPDYDWRPEAMDRVRLLLSSERAEELAAYVQQITHPTGNRARMKDLKVTSRDDTVVAQISIEWRGGIIGAPYLTVIEWSLFSDRHHSAVVFKDNAPGVVSNEQVQKLDMFFRDRVFPVLWKIENDKR